MDEPASEFDGPWKEALEWYFEPFLAFFFPVVHADIDWSRGYEFLDKELQKIAPEAEAGRGTVDKLVKVWTRDGEETWVFVHVEVQSQYDVGFPRRMYVYNHRLEDRYGRMPVSLAILGDDGPEWRPASFQMGRWGCEVFFTFPAIKLLDYRGREEVLERDSNPFAAVTLAHLKTLETRGDVAARQEWKVRLVKGLYERGLNREQILRLFRLIDWIMTLPPVSENRFREEVDRFEKERDVPFIAPIERIWLEEGRAEGRAEMIATVYSGIELGLKYRFGQSGLDLMPRVRASNDPVFLATFLRAIETAPDLDTLRGLLPE
ncbi:MAG: hypothetical protein JWO38_5876 [Gemmataceae bacterium]|nr:hypothetical protein [Gemmataceae bacterium]